MTAYWKTKKASNLHFFPIYSAFSFHTFPKHLLNWITWTFPSKTILDYIDKRTVIVEVHVT